MFNTKMMRGSSFAFCSNHEIGKTKIKNYVYEEKAKYFTLASVNGTNSLSLYYRSQKMSGRRKLNLICK